MKKLVLFSSLFLFLLACSKKSESPVLESTQNFSFSKGCQVSNLENNFDSVGIKHNILLGNILTNSNLFAVDLGDVVNLVEQYSQNTYYSSKVNFPETDPMLLINSVIFGYNSDSNCFNYIKRFFSSEFNDTISSLLTDLNSSNYLEDKCSFFDRVKYVEDAILSNNTSMTETESDIMLGALSTLRYSFDFWSNSGRFPVFYYNKNSKPKEKTINWHALFFIIGADFMGACVGQGVLTSTIAIFVVVNDDTEESNEDLVDTTSVEG